MKLLSKSKVRHLIINKIRHSNSNYSYLYKKLFNLPQWKSAKIIATTMSTGIEINTKPIIKKAWQQNKKVVVPIVFPHRSMKFFLLTPHTRLTKDKYGISEPKNSRCVLANYINLMIVPGLAFSKLGDRLGFGGGYYDRYLKHYHNYSVALARPFQYFDKAVWQTNDNDVKINKIIH